MIDVSHLTKSFSQFSFFGSLFGKKTEPKVAVKDCSFFIPEGQCVGFLGPNGAGKSTTIKILTGILTPTSGQVVVNGLVPYEQRQKHAYSMGVVFGQKSQLWWDLPPLDSFFLLGKIYRVSKHRVEQKIHEMNQVFGFESILSTPVRKLSLGQRMSCELTAAFLHDPKIIFLDEPTIGLDIFAKEAVRVFIKNVHQNKRTTILLTTHDMDDVTALCERLIFIEKGTLVADGEQSELLQKYRVCDVKDLTKIILSDSLNRS